MDYHSQLTSLKLRLTAWTPRHSRRVVLISHQWAGLHHPDPDLKQFSVLQQALRNLAAGKVTMQMDTISDINGIHLEMPRLDEQLECLEWDFWYDYFACPQITATSHSLEYTPEVTAVVQSIPAYCSIASLMLVLAPSIRHSDTGEVISQRTWNSRGWCRLERAATAFSGLSKSILVVSSDTRLLVTASPDWVKGWPAEGNFTLETDRELVRSVTSRLVDIKRRHCWQHGEREKWRFYTALRPKANGSQGCQFGETVDDFLCRYELHTPTCCFKPVLTPLILSSLEGNLDVLRGLLEQSADVNEVVRCQLPEVHIDGFHTALSLAAMLSTKEVVKTLLDWQASIHVEGVKNMHNPSTLSIAGYFGNDRVMKLLIDRGASIDTLDDSGSGPLHVGAFSPTPRVTQLLLEHRADPNASPDEIYADAFFNLQFSLLAPPVSFVSEG